MPINTSGVFFSYARADTDFVLGLAKRLKSAGADVWVDQLDICAGDRWDRAVDEALKSCSCLVVVLSPASVASDNVMDEVSFALEGNKLLVPVLYQACEIPFRLKRVQHIDFTADYDKALGNLLVALGSKAKDVGKREHNNIGEPKREQPIFRPTHIFGSIVVIALIGSFLFWPEQSSLKDSTNSMAIVASPSKPADPKENPTRSTKNSPATKPPVEPPEKPPQTIIAKEFPVLKAGGTPGTQRSAQLDAEIVFETAGALRMEFLLSNMACSEIRLFIYLDETLVKTTDFFEKRTGDFDFGQVSPGKHRLKVSPEGRIGGCNVGHLGSWGGTLILYVSA